MFFLDILKLIFFETRQNKLRKVQMKKQINRLSLTKNVENGKFYTTIYAHRSCVFSMLTTAFCPK